MNILRKIQAKLLNSFLLQFFIGGIQFAANPSPAKLLRDLPGCAATKKWVKHNVIWTRTGKNAGFD